MAYVMEVPVTGGGRLLVQVDEDDLPGGLGSAARGRAGQVVAVAKDSVEDALDQLEPAVGAVASRLKAMAADEVTVEFGIVLSAEGNAIVAKGSAEVHFTVTLAWKKQDVRRDPG
jgi:Trypsin-co-occurring domain 1